MTEYFIQHPFLVRIAQHLPAVQDFCVVVGDAEHGTQKHTDNNGRVHQFVSHVFHWRVGDEVFTYKPLMMWREQRTSLFGFATKIRITCVSGEVNSTRIWNALVRSVYGD